MSAAYAAMAAAAAVLLLQDPAASRSRRVLSPAPRSTSPRRRPLSGGSDPRRDLPLSVSAGVAAALVVGGATGIVVGVAAAAAGVWALRRTRRRGVDQADAELLRALPLAGDLLAACVAAGACPADALAEVARAVTGPLALTLGGVVRAMALGVPAQEAWAPHVADGPPALRTLAAALVRSSVSGSSPGPVIEALAADQRERQRLAGEAAARRAGVAMVAPLGLCFLPAFVLIGVVPLVAGLVRTALDAAG